MYLENVDHPGTFSFLALPQPCVGLFIPAHHQSFLAAPQAFAKFLGGDFSVLDLTRNEDQYSIEDEPVIDLQASKP